MGLTIREGGVGRVRTETTRLREATLALSRAIEDVGWVNLSTDQRDESQYTTYNERKDTIRRARLYRGRSPLAKQAASLLVNYVLGQGLSLNAANKKVVAKHLDEFWEHPVNREAFTSHRAMSEFLVGAFTDGAQYLVLFPNQEEGSVEISTIDPLFVEDEIRDPDNWRVPLWYKVRRPKQKYDFKSGAWEAEADDDFVWYRHWRNDQDSGRGKGRPTKVEEGLVYPCKRGKGKFGESEMAVAIDWLKAHKEFMEDRATLARAAASIAWKKKRKGGAPDVAAEVERLQSSLQRSLHGQGYESNPPHAAASTVVENDLSNLEWVRTDTGGGNALADERILRMMAGAGMGGVPNHYFGDEANANLATATAMELPLLKAYENWQKWLADIVGDLVGFVLEVAHEAGKIGPRDDSMKYSDREVVAKSVLAQPGAEPQPGGEQPAPGQPGGQGPGVREADITVRVKDGREEKDKGAERGAGGDGGTPGTAAPPPPQPQGLVSVFDRLEDDEEPDPDEPVDWYVDVDFPPIIQKDVAQYMEALAKLGALLQGASPEGTRMLASMALTAFGVNDIDKALDRLFPPLQPGQEPELALLPGGQVGGQPPGQGQQPGMAFQPAPTMMLGPGQQQPVRESVAPLRVMRILEAVDEAARVIEARNVTGRAS
jgi:hypothetical protein